MEKIRVLLIDDDPVSNVITAKLIRHTYPDVFIENVSSGLEALQILSKEDTPKPDIIFLDINMPEMTGWDFVEEFKKMNLPMTELVFLTSSNNITDISRAKKIPEVAEYQIKPLSMSKLKIFVKKLMQTGTY